MQAVQFLGDERVAVGESPDPVGEPGDALMKVTLAALCGSELGSLRASREEPCLTGHEAVGIVEDPRDSGLEAGARVALLAVGGCMQCPACERGAFPCCRTPFGIGASHAEYMSVPAPNLLPLPDDFSDETALAVFGCGIGVAYHGARRINAMPGETVLVVGAGPIGLSASLVLRHFGCRVFIADMNRYRLELAEEITDGAATPLLVGEGHDPLAALCAANDGLLADKSFLASGNVRAVALALDGLAPGGLMAGVGAAHGFELNILAHLGARDRGIMGSWHYHREDWEPLVALVRAGLPAERIITHRFPFADAAAAYALFAPGKAGKTILQLA